MKNNRWDSSNIPDQQGKTIIITGANSGLGLDAAKLLAQKGAHVVMGVRDIQKGKQAIDIIKEKHPAAKLEVMKLDLSDLGSVREFSDEYRSKYSTLDLLINNAGIMFPEKRELTKQGFESQFGINHLGHFALTGLLLDILKNTQNSRVVNHSSMAHTMVRRFNLDELNTEKNYSKTKAYGLSKFANLLFTYELDRFFKENQIHAISVACHPGISATNLFRTTNKTMAFFAGLMSQKSEMGVLPLLRAAAEQGLVGSEYFGPAGFMGMGGYPTQVKSNKLSYNRELAIKLWEYSEKATGIFYKSL
jgi:NAD(P)-dependent dehydrogenase (short-subunit alcohol dehydrogenase family)